MTTIVRMFLPLLLALSLGCAGETPARKGPQPDLFPQNDTATPPDSGSAEPDSGLDGGDDSATDSAEPGELLRLSYTPVLPCRIVDSRGNGGIFSKNEQRSYVVYGDDLSAQGGAAAGCTLPAGISTPKAAHINIIALSDAGAGNFAVFRHGSASEPTSGMVNFNAMTGQPYIGNAATVMLCPDGEPSCDKHIAAKLRHAVSAGLVIDVLGYFTEDTAPSGDADKALVYTPVKACRVVDTREKGGKLTKGQKRDYHVYGDAAAISAQGGNSAGCPSPRGEPSAVHLRLTTVVSDAGSQGNVAIVPTNADPEGVYSFVNYKHGYQHTANAGTVKTDHGGGPAGKDIKVVNRNGTTQVIIDVLGYYYPNESAASKPDGDFLFTPVLPCRIVDTRNISDPFGDAEEQQYHVYGTDLSSQGGDAAGCSSPAGEPRAAELTFVAVPSDGAGLLWAFDAGLSEAPLASVVLNYKSGTQNIANAATVATNYDPNADAPEIKVLNKNGKQTDLTITVLGFFHEKP